MLSAKACGNDPPCSAPKNSVPITATPSAPPTCWNVASLGEQHRREETRADGGEDDPGEQGGQSPAVLQVQGEHKEEGRWHQRVGERGQRADPERPAAEQGEIDQRRQVRSLTADLLGGERDEQHRPGRQRQPGPQRPAVLLALGQRQDDSGQPQGRQRGAGQVEL